MRKEEIASLILGFLILAAGIIVSITVYNKTIGTCPPTHMNNILFTFIVIVVSLIFHVIMLEVLHMLGAKLGGYKVVSVNIFYFCFERKMGKLTFSFKDFDGLTGETKIAPKREKVSLKPYIWVPFFAYAAELAGCIVLCSNLSANGAANIRWLAPAALMFVIISSMFAVYNFIPFKLETMTDGYRLVLLSKPANIQAYNEYLAIQDLQRNGQEAPEMKIYEEITEYTAEINLINVYNHLQKEEYKEAEEIVDMMLADPKKLEPYTYNHLISQKMYISIMSKDIEEAKKDYDEVADDKVRRFIANDTSMESVRAYLLISGILEKSHGETNYAIQKKPKAMKRALQSRAKEEDELFERALKKVYEAHPKWKEDKENVAA